MKLKEKCCGRGFDYKYKMSHKHHIMPKHAGGTDDPSNLVVLSIEEHADAHRQLFEVHGRWQDYVAWQGLAKLAPKEELVRIRQKEAAKLRHQLHPNPFTGVKTKHNFALDNEHQNKVCSLANTDKAKEKRKNTFKEIKHQQGEKNSQAGTKWFVEEVANDLSSIKKFKIAPEGWITTTEWRDRRKDKTNSAYGRHWYNDGSNNFYLKENDPQVEKLTRGRLIAVNQN